MASNQRKKKGRAFWWISIALYMIAATVCGIFLGKYVTIIGLADREATEQLLFYAVFFLGCYGAIYLNVITHELGHWLFGRISGYRFVSFRIGSMTWIRGGDEKIHFRSMKLVGTGGQCLLSPPDIKEGKIPVALYNFGGCLLNLLAGSIMLTVFFLLRGEFSMPRLLILFAALFNFVIALTNGIPMDSGMIANDGKNALSLGRDPEAMRAFWLQLKINEMQTRGLRLKDMPEEWFLMPPDEKMDNPMIAALGVFGCNRLMDEGRLEEADERMKHLLRMKSAMNGIYRQMLTCDRMFCEIVGQNRRDVIEAMRTPELLKFMKLMYTDPSVIRTEYAYYLITVGDERRATEKRALFEKFASKYPFEASIVAERELIARADDACEEIKKAFA